MTRDSAIKSGNDGLSEDSKKKAGDETESPVKPPVQQFPKITNLDDLMSLMTTSAPPVAPPQKQPANDENKDGEDDGFDDFGDFGDFSAAPSSQPKAEEKKETAGASNPLDDIFGAQMVTLEDEDQDDDDFGDFGDFNDAQQPDELPKSKSEFNAVPNLLNLDTLQQQSSQLIVTDRSWSNNNLAKDEASTPNVFPVMEPSLASDRAMPVLTDDNKEGDDGTGHDVDDDEDDDFGDFNQWQDGGVKDSQTTEEQKQDNVNDGFGDAFTSAPSVEEKQDT